MTKKRVEAVSSIIVANILILGASILVWCRWGYFEAFLTVVILTAVVIPVCGILNVLTMGKEE